MQITKSQFICCDHDTPTINSNIAATHLNLHSRGDVYNYNKNVIIIIIILPENSQQWLNRQRKKQREACRRHRDDSRQAHDSTSLGESLGTENMP